MKKNLAALLTVILVLSMLLAGCGGKGDNNGNQGANNQGSQVTNTQNSVKEIVEVEPLSTALGKELLLAGPYSETEFVKAMSKISVHQAEAKGVSSNLEVDYSIQALRAAVNLLGQFPASKVEKLLENSGYTAAQISYAMENAESEEAASLIEAELAKFELDDEENELLAQNRGN